MQVDVHKAVVGAGTMALITLCWMLGVGALAAGPLGPALTPVGVAAAIVSALAGGLLVTLLAAPRAQVTAPSSSIAVIYAGLAATLAGRPAPEVWALLSLCVVVCGMLLILAGTLRACDAVHYLPLPVSIGFISGIGLLVIDTQVPSLLGGRPGLLQDGAALAAAAGSIRPGALLVGGVAALITWRAPRHRHGAYGPLAALAAGTALHHALDGLPGPLPWVGPTLGSVDLAAGLAWSSAVLPAYLSSPEWLGPALLEVLPFALVLAFQAAMNGAVTAASLGTVLATRTDLYRVLQAQGVANVLCGGLGALPVCTNAPLSLLAVRFAPYPRLAVLACGFLLVAAVAATGSIGQLPLAAFAGVLVVSGARTIDSRIAALAGRAWRGPARWQAAANLGVIAAVAGLTVSGHVVLGIGLGLALEVLLFLWNLPRRHPAGTPAGRRWRDRFAACEAVMTGLGRAKVQVLRVGEAVFFGNVSGLTQALARLPAGTTHVVMDLSRTHYLDLTALHALDHAMERIAVQGIETLLCGVDRAGRPLRGLHLAAPALTKRPRFASAEAALATLATLAA
ncbi:SulP family inorganic anion transporter [Ramlibacter sp. MAHUQ-53]|uniref:SulP family inorganic anion transporter n=1 Tax=unclassified Ramlibacter TaxID=2617605 RepID=UPI00362D8467